MKPRFFRTPAHLRAWLEKHHASSGELVVGLHKKGSGKPSITWPELVDQVLCFGWIDGVRRSVDEASYTIRITPRRPGSHWSAVNVRRMKQLIEQGLVEPRGLAAFEARDEQRTARYSYERAQASFGDELEATFRRNEAAWRFFESQPPGYRRLATHWVISAKRDETRRRRLETLIEDSAAGRRLGPLRRPERRTP